MLSLRMTLKNVLQPAYVYQHKLAVLATHIRVEVPQNAMGSFAGLSRLIAPDGTVWK